MSADYKQLTKFQDKIDKLNNEQKQQFLEACCKELAARLLRKVIKRTPVGKAPKIQGPKTAKVKGASGKTKSFLTADAARIKQYWGNYNGGQLRRGWTAGKKQTAEEYSNGVKVNKVADKYYIDIVNPVEYASYVEYGHRQNVGRYVPALGKSLKQGWVEGKHMLAISEAELNNASDAILRRKLNKFLEEVFGQ